MNDALNAINNANIDNDKQKGLVLNGFKTCAPLIAALVKLDEQDIESSLVSMLNQIQQYSEACFEVLDVTNETDKESVRAVVLELLKQAYIHEQEQIHDNKDVFVEIVKTAIQNSAISAEVGYEKESPTILSQAKMSLAITVALSNDTSNDTLATRVRQQTIEILETIKSSTKRLTTAHVNQSEEDKLHSVLIDDCVELYKSIHEQENIHLQMMQRGGKDISNYDLDEIVLRRFKTTIEAVIEALMISAKITL